MAPAPLASPAARVSAVRAFNRFYTRRIGALAPGLLHTDHPLPRARLLFELGQSAVTAVADLRDRLKLDAGYLSRLLSALEGDGLLVRSRAREDGRRQEIRLTAAGERAYRDLDQRSSTESRVLLDGLAEPDQRRLLGAMGVLEELLGDVAGPGAIRLRRPAPGDLGWIVQRHGALYAQEYGWDERFETLVARVVADFAGEHDPARERAWIAELDGRAVGSVLCVRRDDEVAQLRLLLVEPEARGMGVGQALLDRCLTFAHDAGYRRISLWTNDVLTDARRLYERAGFTLDTQSPHRDFGHPLVGQDWSRPV